jgi:hypothetical protein
MFPRGLLIEETNARVLGDARLRRSPKKAESDALTAPDKPRCHRIAGKLVI